MFSLDTPLSLIQGIGPRLLAHLGKLHIRTVRDLLSHFPTRYEDYSHIYTIADLTPGQHATIRATIQEISVRRSWRRRMTIIEALLTDGFGSIRAIWFNQPYLINTLRKGRRANFSGKVSEKDGELYLAHPTHEMVKDGLEEETTHTGRLVPIYPETKGLTSKALRFLIHPTLHALPPLKEWLPEEVRRVFDLPELDTALKDIHFPKALEDAERAKKRFAYEDLFLLQLTALQEKLKLKKERAPHIPQNIPRVKEILSRLPFTLTESQRRTIWEIIQDMECEEPMNRLLQGDVGSGKTVVAAIAAFLAAEHGYQAAFMAPTEVLARQHFATLISLKNRMHHRYALGLLISEEARLVYEDGQEATLPKQSLREKIEEGEIRVVVGTHAIIQKNVTFGRLGLVVIDEQHRFGVQQRKALLKKHRRGVLVPHFLSMSATPIPRTLMLTIFGDLELSLIRELPSGRRKIITKIVSPENREKAYAFIRGQIRKGRQAFVICPRIEAPDEISNDNFKKRLALEAKSVKEEHEKLSKKIFPDLRVVMLHGKLRAKEKEKIMADFQDGETDILISTSVVEVGVDVPNATVMMIEGSERFGLAQLYQFRGRVGRGKYQSYCFLFTDSSSKATQERLEAILTAKNGFELAEKDLALRGPGQFLGTEQTGLPDIAMQALHNHSLVQESHVAALSLTKKDKELIKYPLLRKKLEEFKKRIHLE